MAKKKSKKLLPDGAYFKSLVQKITMVHGTTHFTQKGGRSLKLWIAVMILIFFLTLAFIIIVKKKFDDNLIVTQINANCKVSQVPFPAVSICNFNMVSLRESSKIVATLRHYGVKDSETEAFLNALPVLKDYDHRVRDLRNFTEIMTILKSHYYTMDTIMEEVHQKCENLLLFCSFNRKRKVCDNIFSLIKTYEGYCCAFNYAALNDPSEIPLLPVDEDLEYYDDQNSDAVTRTGGIIATSETGKRSGLSVVFNVDPSDYPTWSSVPYYGAKIIISDPNDYPEITILYRYITLGESMDIKIEPMIFQSDTDVRRVDLNKRSCVFHDEVNLAHTNRYSFETCKTECKMKTYLESCGCIPYKYPREQSVRICEFQDLLCLNNLTVHKSIQDMYCKPLCYIECRDKKYSTTSDLVPFLAENFPPDILLPPSVPLGRVQWTKEAKEAVIAQTITFLTSSFLIMIYEEEIRAIKRNYSSINQIYRKGLNVSELAAVQVYFSKSHCNCYKMSLLIDNNYFIATYGGVFSLSFGGSILTIFELFYLFLSLIISLILRAVVVGLYKRRR